MLSGTVAAAPFAVDAVFDGAGRIGAVVGTARRRRHRQTHQGDEEQGETAGRTANRVTGSDLHNY